MSSLRGRPSDRSEHHRVKLAALRFMYGNGIRQLQLVQHIEGVVAMRSSKRITMHSCCGKMRMISPTSPLNTPVPCSSSPAFPTRCRSCFAPHHAVALGKMGVSEALFQLAFTWWIECLLRRRLSGMVPLPCRLAGESTCICAGVKP